MKHISRNVWLFGLIFVTLLLAACGDPTATRVSDPAEFVTPNVHVTTPPVATTTVPATTTNPTTPPVTTVSATPVVRATTAAPSRTSGSNSTSVGGSGWGLTISMSDNGKTINLKLNDRLLVWLEVEAAGTGETWYWQIVQSDPTIVQGVESVAIPRGSQGYIGAFKTGKTTMTATPICFKSLPNCTLPSLNFKAEIVVS